MKKIIAILMMLTIAIVGITAILNVPVPKFDKVFKLTPGNKIVISVLDENNEEVYRYVYSIPATTKDWDYPYDIPISTANIFVIIHGNVVK